MLPRAACMLLGASGFAAAYPERAERPHNTSTQVSTAAAAGHQHTAAADICCLTANRLQTHRAHLSRGLARREGRGGCRKIELPHGVGALGCRVVPTRDAELLEHGGGHEGSCGHRHVQPGLGGGAVQEVGTQALHIGNGG